MQTCHAFTSHIATGVHVHIYYLNDSTGLTGSTCSCIPTLTLLWDQNFTDCRTVMYILKERGIASENMSQ